jgi:hypothetical protein
MTQDRSCSDSSSDGIRIDLHQTDVQDAHNANRCPCSLFSFPLELVDVLVESAI